MPSKTEQAAILAGLEDQYAESYDDVKECEADAGGSSLPENIKNGYAQVKSAEVETTEWGPRILVRAIGLEPEEVQGKPVQFRYNIGEQSGTNQSSGQEWHRSADETNTTTAKRLKLLGPEVDQAFQSGKTWTQGFLAVIDAINENTPVCIFNTGKANNKGFVNAFLRGRAEDGYEPAGLESENEHPETHQPAPATFKKGDRVTTCGDYFGDGNDYSGAVASVNKRAKSCMVEWDDETEAIQVPWANLSTEETEEEEDETPEMEPGDRVTSIGDYFENGEEYSGELISLDDETATVQFDDEQDESEIPAANLKLEE